jgi:hypothetical protein
VVDSRQRSSGGEEQVQKVCDWSTDAPSRVDRRSAGSGVVLGGLVCPVYQMVVLSSRRRGTLSRKPSNILTGRGQLVGRPPHVTMPPAGLGACCSHVCPPQDRVPSARIPRGVEGGPAGIQWIEFAATEMQDLPFSAPICHDLKRTGKFL